MVARGPLRHVHPLGPLQRARTPRMGDGNTSASPCPSTSSSPALHAQAATPRANGRAWPSGPGRRYMVMTTKHHEGFCLFDTKTHQLLRRPSRPADAIWSGVRRGRPRRGPARRLLLLADGLASSRRRQLRQGRGRPQTLRRIHPRPRPRVDAPTTARWTCCGTTSPGRSTPRAGKASA